MILYVLFLIQHPLCLSRKLVVPTMTAMMKQVIATFGLYDDEVQLSGAMAVIISSETGYLSAWIVDCGFVEGICSSTSRISEFEVRIALH